MSYQVRIEPSGRTFTALPQETLLEAALRSGVNVRYNCSNGTCGDCKVRLLEGQVESVMQSDYHFNLMERNEHFILMCTNRAASDLVIQAEEARTPQDIPVQALTAKVAKVDSPSEDVRVVHLRTPRTKSLRFMAGQHVCLTLPGAGKYDAAIASCPCNGTNLQFHFPRHSGDRFLRAVFEGLHIGQKIEVEGPFGDVTLDDDSPRPLLMLAMGTDFAPIKSLIEHAINLDLRQPVRLVWLAPDGEGHYLDNYCRAWGEALDDYRFVALNMVKAEPGKEERVRLREAIEKQLEGLSDIEAYIAGTPLFREVAREHLLTLGADANRILELRRRYARRQVPRVAHA